MADRKPFSRYLRRHKVALIGLLIGSLALIIAQANSGSGDYTFEPGLSAAQDNPGPVVDLKDSRETKLFLPSGYSKDDSVPLLINLHGYTGTGASQSLYTFMQDAANKAGVAYIAPNGTKDNLENNFWNSGKSCCNFNQKEVDDVAYLDSLIDKALAAANINPKQVYLFGHSNGAFMSYAYLCSGSTKIAGVAGLAGAMDVDNTNCGASPNHILLIHGELDETIQYQGGALFGNRFTSVPETINRWSAINDCRVGKETELDLLDSIEGIDTVKISYRCEAGALELWRMPQGKHSPVLDLDFARNVLVWLTAYQS
jgi:polyhydroxybutyrate depolymerase